MQSEKESPIDFAWVTLIGMQMGLSYKEVRRMKLGQWTDLFFAYKKHHNFIVRKCIYSIEDTDIATLDEI